MKTTLSYVADDGKLFERMEDCARYEGAVQLARIFDETQPIPAAARDKIVAALLDNATEISALLEPLVVRPYVED